MELKKLKLGVDKCATVHIGNNNSKLECSAKTVHGEDMKNTVKEKYLGDFVTSSGNSKETICDRNIRGNAIVSEIRAILRDIPLGNQRTQIGLVLRQAWFINGCFVNCEVWTGYSESDLKDLEVIDHDILRAITGAQAKVPTEMLYLETAQVPIKSVIVVRRLLYLQTLLHRHKNELTRQIYDAMKEEPLKDDWIHLVTKDMSDINLNLSDDQISKLSKSELKIIVKSKMRNSSCV